MLFKSSQSDIHFKMNFLSFLVLACFTVCTVNSEISVSWGNIDSTPTNQKVVNLKAIPSQVQRYSFKYQTVNQKQIHGVEYIDSEVKPSTIRIIRNGISNDYIHIVLTSSIGRAINSKFFIYENKPELNLTIPEGNEGLVNNDRKESLKTAGGNPSSIGENKQDQNRPDQKQRGNDELVRNNGKETREVAEGSGKGEGNQSPIGQGTDFLSNDHHKRDQGQRVNDELVGSDAKETRNADEENTNDLDYKENLTTISPILIQTTSTTVQTDIKNDHIKSPTGQEINSKFSDYEDKPKLDLVRQEENDSLLGNDGRGSRKAAEGSGNYEEHPSPFGQETDFLSNDNHGRDQGQRVNDELVGSDAKETHNAAEGNTKAYVDYEESPTTIRSYQDGIHNNNDYNELSSSTDREISSTFYNHGEEHKFDLVEQEGNEIQVGKNGKESGRTAEESNNVSKKDSLFTRFKKAVTKYFKN